MGTAIPCHYFPASRFSHESSMPAGDLLSRDIADLHEAAVLTKR